MDEKLDKILTDIELKFETISDKMVELTTSLTNNSQEIMKLNDKIEWLESLTFKNKICINGIKEDTREHLLSIVTNLINNTMKIKCNIWDINDLHRIGKLNKFKNRTLIVDFASNLKKQEILKSRNMLKGTEIFLNGQLSNKSYNLLKKAKSKYGNNSVWTWNGQIFIKENDAVRQICLEEDI
ncbi:unnamed protein product [Psylliodes chrysocephalus]|uniref:Uncharacterized protein n=1 Tax=Psylliodes chrysocephalus TaxID=3402493 RepID=A0A9P0G9A8_9CUCU|nr:unnamed protein product [Psylliodes chrysocephala]